MRLTSLASVVLFVCVNSSFAATPAAVSTTPDNKAVQKNKVTGKPAAATKADTCASPKNIDLPQETVMQKGAAFTPQMNPAQYLKNMEELKYTAIKSNPLHIMSIEQQIESPFTTMGLKRTAKTPYNTVALRITYPVSVFKAGAKPCVWDFKNEDMIAMLQPALKASDFGLHAELYLPKQALHNATRMSNNMTHALSILEGTIDNPVLELSYTAPKKEVVTPAVKNSKSK